jgi:hypothetical protein
LAATLVTSTVTKATPSGDPTSAEAYAKGASRGVSESLFTLEQAGLSNEVIQVSLQPETPKLIPIMQPSLAERDLIAKRCRGCYTMIPTSVPFSGSEACTILSRLGRES